MDLAHLLRDISSLCYFHCLFDVDFIAVVAMLICSFEIHIHARLYEVLIDILICYGIWYDFAQLLSW